MTTEKLIEQVLSSLHTIHAWKHLPDSPERRAMSKLHKIMYGEALNATPKCGCVEDFATVLRGKNPGELTQKIIDMENKIFKLRKENSIVQSGALSRPLTRNSSDEDCLKVIANNPKTISLFSEYPENWRELAGLPEEETTEEETTEEETTEEETTEEETTEEETTEKSTPDFNAMGEKQLRQYAKDNGISLKGKTGVNQVREIIIAHVNDI